MNSCSNVCWCCCFLNWTRPEYRLLGHSSFCCFFSLCVFFFLCSSDCCSCSSILYCSLIVSSDSAIHHVNLQPQIRGRHSIVNPTGMLITTRDYLIPLEGSPIIDTSETVVRPWHVHTHDGMGRAPERCNSYTTEENLRVESNSNRCFFQLEQRLLQFAQHLETQD